MPSPTSAMLPRIGSNVRSKRHTDSFRVRLPFSHLFIATAVFYLLFIIPFSHAGLNRAEFPRPGEIPDVAHPQVKEWLSQIDLSGAPSIELGSGDPPDCPMAVPEGVCYWTCEGCSADDVVTCPDLNAWGLTFNAGPTPATQELLDFLGEKQVKATFFLIGSNVVDYPETVSAQVKSGHHLASLTWSHHALTTMTNEQIVAQIKWTEKAIEDATGYRVRYVRPPYGDIDNRVRYVLKELGYVVVDWSGDEFDSNDWKIPEISSSTVITEFQKSLAKYAALGAGNDKGFISLEHDSNSVTVGVAKDVVSYGMERNLMPMTIAECRHDSSPYANTPDVMLRT